MDNTLLHLSDIQYGRHHVDKDSCRQPLYLENEYSLQLEKMKADLGILAEAGIVPNFIVVTGDIAEWSLKKEYELAEYFLGGLADYLKLDRRYVIMIPGNHDINRKICQAARLYAEAEDKDFIPPYFPKFKFYADFFHRFYKNIQWPKGIEPYQFLKERLFVNFYFPEDSIMFAGLNSCVDESEQEPHHGKITIDQLRAASSYMNSFDPDHAMLRVALMHHNFVRSSEYDEENLKDADLLKPILLENGYQMILHGHQHVSRDEVTGKGNSVIKVLATGSTGLDSETLPENCRRYQIINIEGNQVKVFRRCFDKTINHSTGQGAWKPDLAPDQTNMYDSFTISNFNSQKKVSTQQTINQPKIKRKIYFHNGYPLPKYWVGRGPELNNCLNHLLNKSKENTASVITIISPGGEGKSCLSRKLLDELELQGNPFDGIFWYSFYKSKVNDASEFFKEALAYCQPDYFKMGIERKPAENKSDLLKVIREEKLLFILDGCELLQNEGKSRVFGTVIDNLLQDFLINALNWTESKIILTSRFPFPELEKSNGYLSIRVGHLSPSDARQYLKMRGVKAKASELESLCKRLGYHALSIEVAADYISSFCKGRIVKDVRLEDMKDETPAGEKLNRLIALHWKQMDQGKRFFFTRLIVFYGTVLSKHLPLLQMPGSSKMEFDKLLNKLHKNHLLEINRRNDGEEEFNAHPLVKLAIEQQVSTGEIKKHHVDWAKAATMQPKSSVTLANSIKELEPHIHLFKHLLDGDWFEEAFKMAYSLLYRLQFLGHYKICSDLGNSLLGSEQFNYQNLEEQIEIRYELIFCQVAFGLARQALTNVKKCCEESIPEYPKNYLYWSSYLNRLIALGEYQLGHNISKQLLTEDELKNAMYKDGVFIFHAWLTATIQDTSDALSIISDYFKIKDFSVPRSHLRTHSDNQINAIIGNLLFLDGQIENATHWFKDEYNTKNLIRLRTRISFLYGLGTSTNQDSFIREGIELSQRCNDILQYTEGQIALAKLLTHKRQQLTQSKVAMGKSIDIARTVGEGVLIQGLRPMAIDATLILADISFLESDMASYQSNLQVANELLKLSPTRWQKKEYRRIANLS